ncbi:MAG TPA: NAD(P)H-dependent oxidoreductase [Xanthobacteraceae bacterium]|nr:NAD(P)H-dependent oxidoreductase [Xanthobacteraceae bacterium]
MSPLKILVIPGSVRTGSLNVRLAATAMAELVDLGADVSLISLSDYPLPIYDGDLEARSGVPAPAVDLTRMIGAHDGVLLVSPEYNASPPPLLKNALDWVTRVRDRNAPKGHVMRGRPFALASASAGRFGGARCLMMLRLMLSACRVTVIPDQLSLSFADQAYDDLDRLKHSNDRDMLKALARQLIEVAEQMRHHD